VNRIKLIQFDFDGTLVDSKDDIAASANYALTTLGLEPKPKELIAGFIGDGVYALMQRALGTSEKRKVEEAVALFRKHYGHHCLDRTRDFPGVREALEKLCALKKAIVTNKPKGFTERILEGLSLSRYFELVVGGDGPYPRKPAPDAFEAVARQFGVKPQECLVVGDSPNDILGGRAAGCLTCAVTYGLGSREALEAAAPDAFVDSAAELPAVVERL